MHYVLGKYTNFFFILMYTDDKLFHASEFWKKAKIVYSYIPKMSWMLSLCGDYIQTKPVWQL